MDDEGLELLMAIVQEGPWMPGGGVEEDYCCYFCGCEEDQAHEPDCSWARARAYLKDQGVEVESKG